MEGDVLGRAQGFRQQVCIGGDLECVAADLDIAVEAEVDGAVLVDAQVEADLLKREARNTEGFVPPLFVLEVGDYLDLNPLILEHQRRLGFE